MQPVPEVKTELPAEINRTAADGATPVWFWPGCAALLGLYLAISLFHINTVPLLDPDEPRYAAAGRTMSRGGSLLVPEFNGNPRINKPPLFYWLVALSDVLGGGASEASSRMPSVVMGLLMLGGTVLAGWRIYGPATGLLAGVMLCTMPLFFALARCCITDMTLSSFMALSLIFLLLAFTRTGPPVLFTWLAALSLGLALLTKATPALAVLAAILFERALSPGMDKRRALQIVCLLVAAGVLCSGAALYFNHLEARHATAAHQQQADPDSASEFESHAGRFGKLDDGFKLVSLAMAGTAALILAGLAFQSGAGWLQGLPWISGLFVALALGVWWYLALIANFGWPEFKRLLQYETLGRLAGDMHREGMHYYIPTLFLISFPWALGLPGALGAAWQEKEKPPVEREGQADRFLLAWLLGIVFFFSVPNAKLATYILPALPAAALLISRYVIGLAGSGNLIGTLTLVLALLSGAAFLIGGFFLSSLPQLFSEFALVLAIPFTLLCAVYGASIIGGWLLILRRRQLAGALTLCAGQAFFIFLVTPAAIPTFFENRSARSLCLQVKDKIADCDRVASVGAEVESLSYYLDRTIAESRRRRVVKRRASTTGAVLPNEPPVTEDEPFDAVVKEELARPEKVALFVQRRYYARMLGIKNKDFDAMSREQIIASVPAYAKFVEYDKDTVVIRNR